MIHSGILGFNIGASISNNNQRMSPYHLRSFLPTNQRTKIKFHILIFLLVQVITPNSVLSSSLGRLWNFMFPEFTQLYVLHLIRLE